MPKHLFQSHITWPGGRNAIGDLQTAAGIEKISIPTTMAGPGIGANPDELLLAAASTCYTITLAALLERNQINTLDFQVDSEATVSVDKGVFKYEDILHKLRLQLEKEADYDKAYKLAEFAERSCMISKALQGNVSIRTQINLESSNQ